MDLAELKAENEAEAAGTEATGETQENQGADETQETGETQGSDGTGEAQETEETDGPAAEAWLETEPDGAVPVGTHIKIKQKLKGRISDQADELERLKAEVESLKSRKPEPVATGLKRPVSDDFATDEEYQTALSDYDDQAAAARYDRVELQRKQSDATKAAKAAVETAVDSHYERMAKLVDDHGIAPEVCKAADAKVRQTVEAIQPGLGDAIVDRIISVLGEGSEKVMVYLGRNKSAEGEMAVLLGEDPSGMKLMAYLGQQKERLTNPERRTSRAPKPAAQASGDANANSSGAANKRKYDEAHKKGRAQDAYNIKKAARVAGVNVSAW